MKYFLFAGESYYPCGGINDFVGIYDSEEEAKEVFNKGRSEASRPLRDCLYDWGHIAIIKDNKLEMISFSNNLAPGIWIQQSKQ